MESQRWDHGKHKPPKIRISWKYYIHVYWNLYQTMYMEKVKNLPCFSDLSLQGPGITETPIIIPDTLCAFCKSYNSISPQHATRCQKTLCDYKMPFQQQGVGALGGVFAPVNQPILGPTAVTFARN